MWFINRYLGILWHKHDVNKHVQNGVNSHWKKAKTKARGRLKNEETGGRYSSPKTFRRARRNFLPALPVIPQLKLESRSNQLTTKIHWGVTQYHKSLLHVCLSIRPKHSKDFTASRSLLSLPIYDIKDQNPEDWTSYLFSLSFHSYQQSTYDSLRSKPAKSKSYFLIPRERGSHTYGDILAREHY